MTLIADLHGAGVVKRLQENEFPLVRAALSTVSGRLRPLLVGWAALHGNESAVVVRSRRARAGNEHVIENGWFRRVRGVWTSASTSRVHVVLRYSSALPRLPGQRRGRCESGDLLKALARAGCKGARGGGGQPMGGLSSHRWTLHQMIH